MRRITWLAGALPLLRYALATTAADPSVVLVGALLASAPLLWWDTAGHRRGTLEEIVGMQLTLGIAFSHVALGLWVLRRLRKGAGRLALGGVCGARGGLLLAAYGTAISALSPASLFVDWIALSHFGPPGLLAAAVAVPVVCGAALALDFLSFLGMAQRAWPAGPLGQLRESWRLAGVVLGVALAVVPWRLASPWVGQAGGTAVAAASAMVLLGLLAGPVERLARRQ